MGSKTYFINTFGCQANVSDSERIAGYLEEQGLKPVKDIGRADWVVINTCMVRQMAEDRVYGLLNNLGKARDKTGKPTKIIVTGCMVGMAIRDKSGKMMRRLREDWPVVDEWLAMDEIGPTSPRLRGVKFEGDFRQPPGMTGIDSKKKVSTPGVNYRGEKHAWVPISNGCNNYCAFCVVPFTRGREVSRPFEEIIDECRELVSKGYTAITLLGQNVNSYGADLVMEKKVEGNKRRQLQGVKNRGVKPAFVQDFGEVKPVMVKHLGRMRIPTLFPALLETICLQCPEFTQIEFVSSNPWDFSDELIEVIAKFSQISRRLHLPVQAGSNKILKAMNRWYTREEYLDLVIRIKDRIPGVELTTDIIVGFPGETEEDFNQTVDLVKQVGFVKSYTARYSPRPMTAAGKLEDDVSHEEKKRRWKIIDKMVNGGKLKSQSSKVKTTA